MKGIFKPSVVAVALGLAVSGCNVSLDTNDDKEEELKVGYFVDSGVEGIYYETESEVGFTGSGGMFYYKEGESITFSVGDVNLPSTMAKELITPVDLVNAVPTDPTVVNILQFLQSLDDDADPSNGIYITSAIDSDFTGESLDFTSATFDADFKAILTPLNLTLVSEQAAIAHFLNLPNFYAGSMLHGSWVFTEKDDDEQIKGRHVFTFVSDNKYVLVHENEDTEGGDQIAGSVEYGKYSIDELTGEFKVEQVISASDGDGGLDNEGRPTERYFNYNTHGQLELIMREAPELANGEWDTNRDNWGDYNTLYLENVSSTTDPLAGSWILPETDENGDPIPDSLNVLTILSDGEYLIAHTMNQEAYGDATPVSASSEWGTWESSSAGSITINTPSIDLDGSGGLYDAESTPTSEVKNISIASNGDLVLELMEGDGTSNLNIMPVFSPMVIMASDVAGTSMFHFSPGEGDDMEFTDIMTFNTDGTGSFYEQGGDTTPETFTWSINDSYQLEVATEFQSKGIFTLVAGQLHNGYLLNDWDDEGDGVFEDQDILVKTTSNMADTTIIPLLETDITGTVLFSYSDTTGNPIGTGEFSFMSDGSGSVKWNADPNDLENFTWSITQEGKLEIDLENAPTSDLYSLIEGSFHNGELIGEIDQDEANGDRETNVKIMSSSSVIS